MEKIGENIRRIRLLMGYKQQTIAESLNLSLYYYGQMERGKVPIDQKRIELIAQIMNVKVLYLLNFDSLLKLIQQNHFSKIET
ncbi:MAG: XRE family transcriptional regulator [Pedobacter sp.]|nr:MAG: XRE family transcriptional regulator [Pedobacter sp.]